MYLFETFFFSFLPFCWENKRCENYIAGVKRAIRGSVWETQIKECGFPASFSVFLNFSTGNVGVCVLPEQHIINYRRWIFHGKGQKKTFFASLRRGRDLSVSANERCQKMSSLVCVLGWVELG